jgi:hypothetical protein
MKLSTDHEGNARAMAEKTQAEKFKQAARELEADEDEGRWEERLKKVAKAKPGSTATE